MTNPTGRGYVEWDRFKELQELREAENDRQEREGLDALDDTLETEQEIINFLSSRRRG